jgi:hypothetical protein
MHNDPWKLRAKKTSWMQSSMWEHAVANQNVRQLQPIWIHLMNTHSNARTHHLLDSHNPSYASIPKHEKLNQNRF